MLDLIDARRGGFHGTLSDTVTSSIPRDASGICMPEALNTAQ